jgi:two-component system, NtrC family, sensor kinase
MSSKPVTPKKIVFPSPFSVRKKKKKDPVSLRTEPTAALIAAPDSTIGATPASMANAEIPAADTAMPTLGKKNAQTLHLFGKGKAKPAKSKNASAGKNAFPLAPLLLVAAGVGLSFFLFRQLSAMHDRETEAALQSTTVTRAAELRQAFSRAEETVSTVALLANAAGDVRAYNAGVQAAMARNPHILAMAWLENFIPEMSAPKPIAATAAASTTAPMLGDIPITTRSAEGRFEPSGAKPFYLPLVNLQINSAAKPNVEAATIARFNAYVGFDFSSDKAWQSAFTTASAKGVTQFVDKGLTNNDRLLLQKVMGADGRLIGYVVAVIALDQMMGEVSKDSAAATAAVRLYGRPANQTSQSAIERNDATRVFPASTSNAAQASANPADNEAAREYRARFTQAAPLQAFGRDWMLEVEPSTQELRTRDSALPALVGLLGLLGTLVGVAAMIGARKRTQMNEIKLAEAKLDLLEAQDRAKDSENLSMQAEQELAGAFKQLRDSELTQMQNEKMSSLGVMVAGVAHEINTPLGFVSSNVEYMGELTDSIRPALELQLKLMENVTHWAEMTPIQRKAWYDIAMKSKDTLAELKERDALGEIHELVQESTSGLERISEIVRSLKDFSRVDRAQVDAVDLHQGIDSTLIIAQNVTKHKADIVKNYGEIPLIPCSPSQINQVILNLVSNAAQAIPEFGTITLSTRVDGEFVAVDVADNGTGMSEEVSSQIFKPFFTTKGAGEGTGLGLAICEKIIQAHKGTISVQSEVGVGTTFTIRLPIQNA